MVVMSRRRVFLLALVAFLLIPAAAFAGSLFTDVDDGNTHFKGIEFLKNSGVSIGCGDGTTFCPDDPVTRAQMGTFMYRLSGTDPGTPPSVNADKVDGLEATSLDSAGYSVWHDNPMAIADATLLELNVPAGSYIFIGKTVFRNGTAGGASAACKLSAGSDFDEVLATVPGFNWVPATFMVVHTFGSADTVTLACTSTGSPVEAYDTKVTAIEVNALSNGPG